MTRGGTIAVSSTTEHVATGSVEGMTAAQARYHLKRARERIASLVAMLDDERGEKEDLRREVRRLRRILGDVRVAISASDERSD